MIPFSVLDLSPIVEGGSAAQALANSLDLARHAERLGYKRVWLAEHHNFPGIASSATSLAIAHVAAGTKSIRVGAGGIMLPNHAPLVIAEQFGTLEALHPGRIDLALGRAPGTDQVTSRALRASPTAGEDFPYDVRELMGYLADRQEGRPTPEGLQSVRAIPGEGSNVPVWILGSSLYGAQFAAAMGLPYAFASHFAPRLMTQAIAEYRNRFRPNPHAGSSPWHLEKPYLMLGINVYAADSERDARTLMSSRLQSTLNLRLGRPGRLPPPVEDFEDRLGAMERAIVAEMNGVAVIGTRGQVRDGFAEFIAKTGADELIIASQIYDHQARVHSYEIAAGARADLGKQESR